MMSSQIAVGVLRKIAMEYDVKEASVTAGRRQSSPAQVTITAVLHDGTAISICKNNELQPFISEEQYGEIVLQSGKEMLNRIAPVLAIRH